MVDEKNQNSLIKPEIEKKITQLMETMTLEEKIGQLNQLGPDMTSILAGYDVNFDDMLTMFLEDKISKNEFDKFCDGLKEELHEDLIREGKIGAFVGLYYSDKINAVQKIAVEESRLGIPLLVGVDVVRGFRTIFPSPLAESCSWEPELAKKSAEIAAKEASAAGVHWTFGPMLDIARDPRWGRIVEGVGEDTYLTSVIADAKVRGFQGDDFSEKDKLVACAKHFVAYGGAVGGRDYNTVDISPQALYDIYLPPFKAAINAGIGGVMTSFNDLNGIPCTIDKNLISNILKKELEFDGVVVSDATAIGECVVHGAVEDKKDAAIKAIVAGVDVDMSSNCYANHGYEIIKEGTVSESILDEAVRRVLRIKFLKGLFDNPYINDSEKEKNVTLCKEHIEAAREVARRSIVLLKNEEKTLPLSKDVKKIAVVGPLSDDREELLGPWAFTGNSENLVTVLSGIKEAVSDKTEVTCVKGCEINNEDKSHFEEAIKVANESDIVIAVVGESKFMSGEAASRADIGLPGVQEDMIKELQKTGKPVVVILINGRPLTISWLQENVSAIVEGWHLGVQCGNAIADVLFGDYNPSGKLTVTFPYCVGQVPINYNHPNTGKPGRNFKFTSKYLDAPLTPLYPFGYGLSYTNFEYMKLEVSPKEIEVDGNVTVEATIKNTGDVFGEEVVQLYVRDLVGSRVRPVKELKGFQKIGLNPGESKRVTFDIEAAKLGFHNENLEYIVEPGKFKVWIASNSVDGIEGEFSIN